MSTRVLSAQSLAVATQAVEAHFNVMLNGRVAEVDDAAVQAVLALDEAHAHLVSARVVAASPPSERWYRLLGQFGTGVTAPKSALADPVSEVDEYADRFARDLLVDAAAFLAAESNDLEDHISLLAGDDKQDEICGRLHDIADEVGAAADGLIGRLDGDVRRESSIDLHGESESSQLQKGRQSTLLGYMKMVFISAAAGSMGVVIALFGDSFRRNAPLTAVILLTVGLLLFLGMMLGASWTSQALQWRTRRLAEERRELNEAWSVVHGARQQRGEWTHSVRSEDDWYAEQRTDEEYDDRYEVI